MLTLASMVWAAYLYLYHEIHPKAYTPLPVVIETGEQYQYNLIESAMYVPSNWTDSCENQKQVIYYMGLHFNAFKNGNNKIQLAKIVKLSNDWTCIE